MTPRRVCFRGEARTRPFGSSLVPLARASLRRLLDCPKSRLPDHFCRLVANDSSPWLSPGLIHCRGSFDRLASSKAIITKPSRNDFLHRTQTSPRTRTCREAEERAAEASHAGRPEGLLSFAKQGTRFSPSHESRGVKRWILQTRKDWSTTANEGFTLRPPSPVPREALIRRRCRYDRDIGRRERCRSPWRTSLHRAHVEHSRARHVYPAPNLVEHLVSPLVFSLKLELPSTRALQSAVSRAIAPHTNSHENPKAFVLRAGLETRSAKRRVHFRTRDAFRCFGPSLPRVSGVFHNLSPACGETGCTFFTWQTSDS